ncbi:glutenin, high molecular weight subunit DX5-like [Melanaphis sacchari]|uniref:glutenin, high molecular weight subunit DX5-like n=1 Tax=Melanaphis sacchari TaxID=742174 RepID=UPI000DC13CEF|nr:glutenin, high molecular weight subunit DX5-like [Melanaphis sacchari]
MFKFLTLSCLLAVSVQCKISQNQAVPYYPQPYPATYPQVYPQFYSAQPKYSVQPAYVATASYPAPVAYRQVFVPANPAYNPYYYGYAPYPANPQVQQYPYPYVQNDGTQPAAAQPGWGEYLSNSFWSYVPNFPYVTSGAQPTSEAESGTAAATSETSAENTSPGKGDKPAEGSKSEQATSGEQPSQSPSKQFAAYPLPYFGQAPYQQAVYDPVKLNAANNGAVSSFLFPKSQFQSVFQQPQPVADQKYYQTPQSNQGTAAQAYQRYLQSQKQYLQGQYQQDQPFQQQTELFQQQYDQQPQKDESSVVVDSNVTGLQVNAEGQQLPQSKVATGSN